MVFVLMSLVQLVGTMHNICKIQESSWVLEFGNWLEYKVSNDTAFYFCCYLIRFEIGEPKVRMHL